jgi:RimJ/RimL family protein N-acetyltransferase
MPGAAFHHGERLALHTVTDDGYAVDDRGLHRVTARGFETNDASRRVLEKVGFEREGTLRDHYYVDGEYVDAHVYGLLDG